MRNAMLSLKAKLCASGAAEMVRFCAEHGIPHDICGKVVVATSDGEIPALEELHRRGMANGVAGITIIGPEEFRELEPHAAGVRALHVPSTGITDYAAVSRKYAELLTSAGGTLLTNAEVLSLRLGQECVAETRAGTFTASTIVNCAGLYSDRIARMAGADPGVRIIPFRGE